MTKKHIIFCLLFFAAIQLKAKITVKADTIQQYSIKMAQTDVKNGNLKFLLRGGIVATYFKGQELFEKKFGIRYQEFGCVMPGNISLEAYNKTVAYYLDHKYGKGWRREVRRDVAGI